MSSNAPTMHGLTLPDVDVWSERIAVALGQNPSPFSGPGTNTYLIGTGAERILLDPGQGIPSYPAVLDEAMARVGCESIQEIVLTHGHPDHLGGVPQMLETFGPLKVSKFFYPDWDDGLAFACEPLADGGVVKTEGATLRAVHTPGHAPDHLCFVVEEERALISGDNVLGVGTTVIPAQSGDLGQYMASLERMLALEPTRIYPAHGPVIEDGRAKIREYIAHRHEREAQIVAFLDAHGASEVMAIVREVYAAYPKHLFGAAAQSVTQHLMKLEREARAEREGEDPVHAVWTLR